MDMPMIEVEVWACDMALYTAFDGFVPTDAWVYYGTWTYQSCSITKPTDAIAEVLRASGKMIRYVHTK